MDVFFQDRLIHFQENVCKLFRSEKPGFSVILLIKHDITWQRRGLFSLKLKQPQCAFPWVPPWPKTVQRALCPAHHYTDTCARLKVYQSQALFASPKALSETAVLQKQSCNCLEMKSALSLAVPQRSTLRYQHSHSQLLWPHGCKCPHSGKGNILIFLWKQNIHGALKGLCRLWEHWNFLVNAFSIISHNL